MKATFAIKGLEPQARSIFAFESIGKKKQEQFTKDNSVFVCRNGKDMFFSKDIKEAFNFNDEDSACNVIDILNSKESFENCEWETVLLIDGIEATDEQLVKYANNEL